MNKHEPMLDAALALLLLVFVLTMAATVTGGLLMVLWKVLA